MFVSRLVFNIWLQSTVEYLTQTGFDLDIINGIIESHTSCRWVEWKLNTVTFFAEVFEKQFICLEHYIETTQHNHRFPSLKFRLKTEIVRFKTNCHDLGITIATLFNRFSEHLSPFITAFILFLYKLIFNTQLSQMASECVKLHSSKPFIPEFCRLDSGKTDGWLANKIFLKPTSFRLYSV